MGYTDLLYLSSQLAGVSCSICDWSAGGELDELLELLGCLAWNLEP